MYLSQSLGAFLLVSPLATFATRASSIDSATWNALNATVAGKLYQATPLAAPCFSFVNGERHDPNGTDCAAVQAGYTDPAFRTAQFAGYMMPQWETCQSSSQQCLLDSSNPSDSLAWTEFNCSQGSIAPYYIDIQEPSDAVAAFQFAQATGVELVIKNSGHDYKGRSSQSNALGLWVHNLKGITYDPNFTPSGCSADTSYHAITVGAGVDWQEIYDFADDNNITAVGGYHQTIAASGGWVMGGGHSILSPVFGLGVDRVREFKIVTPDGIYRTANECTNPDLFWALRGGGGGTFGVVMQSTHVVEPNPLPLSVAHIAFTGNTSVQSEWLQILVDCAVQWGNVGWGGHMTNTGLINVSPLLSLAEANATMAAASSFATAHGGTALVETLPNWNTFFKKYVLAAEAGVGVPTALGTRLMTTSLFETDEGRSMLHSALVDLLSFANPYIVVGTPFLYNATANATSVTPAWYNSLWHLGCHATWNFNTTLADKISDYEALDAHVQAWRDLTPGSGAYFNEGDVYETDHEQAYWGANYPRLLEIKAQYDPNHLLDCWQCVGWQGQQAEKYQCYPNVSTSSS